MRLRSYLYSILALLAPLSAGATDWRSIDPGVSKRADVTARFDEPSRTLRVGPSDILVYRGGASISGTEQVQFRIERASGLVERIDVYPAADVDRETVESTFGGRCPATPAPDLACYVSKLRQSRVYFHYPTLGLAVFFQADGKRVFSFVYTPDPGAEERRRAREAEAEAEAETGSSFGAGEDDPFAAFEDIEAAALKDTLEIGGLLYLNLLGSLAHGPPPPGEFDHLHEAVNLPGLVDLYLDGRPNDRVRGMMVGRLVYDAALPLASGGRAPVGVEGTGSSGAGPMQDPAQNPLVLLDQLWLKFDLARKVFLTIGRQHAKWGTGRVWNVVDFLAPFRRDPLALFDFRVGNDMLKVQVPLPSLGANLYAVTFVNTSGPEDSPFRLGGALRGEVVFGAAELALSMVAQEGRRPRYGFDFSAGLPFVDVYGEVALTLDSQLPRFGLREGVSPTTPFAERFEPLDSTGFFPLVTVGASLPVGLDTDTSMTVVLEGYYNSAGYVGAEVIPWLLLNDAFDPIYSSQLQAALMLNLQTTRYNDLSANVVLLGNLSDGSFIAQANASMILLRDLTIEASLMAPFGTVGGGHRMGLDIPPFLVDGQTVPATRRPTPLVAASIGLRIAL